MLEPLQYKKSHRGATSAQMLLSMILMLMSSALDSSIGAEISTDMTESSMIKRSLYSQFPVAGGHYSVDTLSNNITKPSGVEAGYFKGHYGLFVSSTMMYTISFFHYRTFERTLVAGVPHSYGSYDAQLLYSLFAGPTRMSYDFKNNRLYVAERRSGNIRILDFPSDQTKTLQDSATGQSLRLQYNIQTGSTYPGMDLQISDDVLYAVDTVKLYAIVAADGSGLVGLPYHGAVLTEFTGLTQYFAYKGYDFSASLRSCLYSVAPDNYRRVLYVAVSYARNVILKVPMDPGEPYTAISVLMGDEADPFMGNIAGSIPPAAQNGNIYLFEDSAEEKDEGASGSASGEGSAVVVENSDQAGRMLNDHNFAIYPNNVLLSFPMHLRLSQDAGVLYFSEAYPTTSDDRYFFGSLSIRRLVFASGEVDTYAGVDQSHDNSTAYIHIGGEGGTGDGLVEEAEFVYPMSFCVVDSARGGQATAAGMPLAQGAVGVRGDTGSRALGEEDVVFDTLIVADHSSHSVRRVFAFMDTAEPTSAPSMYVPPTPAPTPSPTSLHGDFAFGASTALEASAVLALCLVLLVCLMSFVGFCAWRRKRQDVTGEALELSPAHSSASMMTLAATRAMNLFAAPGPPQYEEMDASSSSQGSSLENIDLDAEEGRRWADVPPQPPSSWSSGHTGSGRTGSGSGLWTRLVAAVGSLGVQSQDRRREIAVHSLLDVSVCSSDEE